MSQPLVLAGRFVLEREVAAGGMGKIFRARDREQGDAIVAVKLVTTQDELNLLRFERECVALASIQHPNIVGHVAHGISDDGEPWLAMEWLEGHDLNEALDEVRASRASPTVAIRPSLLERGFADDEVSTHEATQVEMVLSPRDVVTLGRGIAAALSALHEAGIVHRDIKPSNVFLVAGDFARVKLIDLGIARVDASAVTLTGTLIGTPFYMAPEQARADRALTPAVDVFALGCVLYECLVGRSPFWAPQLATALVRILFIVPPPVSEQRPDVPAQLATAISAMLAKPVSERPADGGAALALLAALDVDGEQGPVAASEVERVPQLTHSEQRVLCMLFVREPGELRRNAAGDTAGNRASLVERAEALLAPTGTHSAPLLDGSVVVVADAGASPSEAASRLARAGLELLAAHPELVLTMSAERSELASRTTTWSQSAAPSRGASGVLRVDDTIAALLESRFELAHEGEDGPIRVLRQRPQEALRRLLGRPTRTVGRKRDLAVLTATWEECESESRARVVLVTAPAGLGKTRLVHDFLQEVRDAEVLYGRGDAVAAGAPFMLIASALRRSAGLDGCVDERAQLDAYVARALTDPAVRTRHLPLLGVLAGVHFDDAASEILRSARSDPELLAEAVKNAFVAWLKALAKPTLIVLEDVHWGDVPSLRLIESALALLSERPLLVLALARPEVKTRFPTLFADQPLTEHRLEPLPARASAELVRQCLPDASDALVEALVRRADGHAFYLEELIRSVAEGGNTESALPETVLAMVQARLDAVGPNARRLLRAASAFGEVFWKAGVAHLIEGSSTTHDDTARWLAELVAREMIVAANDTRIVGQAQYRFRHALVRDAAYASLTDADRAVAHQRAGEWLELVGVHDAVVLSLHYCEAGDAERARHWLTLAADHALESNDFEAAVRRANAAEALGDGPELGKVHAVRAIANHWRGANRDSVVDALRALDRLVAGSADWFRVAGYGLLSASRGADKETVTAIVSRVRALDPAQRDPAAETERLIYFIREPFQLYQVGLGAEVATSLAQLPPLDTLDARADLDARLKGQVYELHSGLAAYAGDIGVAYTLMKRSNAWLARAGASRNVVMQRCAMGATLVEMGDFESAVALTRDNLEQAIALKSPAAHTFAKQQYGHALAASGDRATSKALLMEAIDENIESKNVRLEGISRMYLAEQALSEGDLARAEGLALEAEACFTRLDLLALRVWAMATHAQILLELEAAQQPSQAPQADPLERAHAAMAGLEKLGGTFHGETLIPLVLVRSLRARGLDATAERADAIARLERRVQRLPPEFRDHFLRLPHSQATLAL